MLGELSFKDSGLGLEAVEYPIVNWLLLPQGEALRVPTRGSVWLRVLNTCLGYSGTQNEVAIPGVGVRRTLQDWVQRQR